MTYYLIYILTNDTFCFAACQSYPLGLRYGDDYLSRNEYFTASSIESPVKYARLLNENGAWVPKSDDANPYIEFALMFGFQLCAIATQGHPKLDQWTTKYRVAVSMDNMNFTYVENGKVRYSFMEFLNVVG